MSYYVLTPLLTYLAYIVFYVKIDELHIDMVLIRGHLFKAISLVVTFLFVVILNQLVSYVLFKNISFNPTMAFMSIYLGLMCVVFKKIDHVKFDHQQFHRNLNECKNTSDTGLTDHDFNAIVAAIRKKQTLTHMLFNAYTNIFFIQVHSKWLKVLFLHGTDSSRNLLNHFSVTSSSIINKNKTSFFKRFIGMMMLDRFKYYSYPANGSIPETILSVHFLLTQPLAPVKLIYEIDKKSLQDDLTPADYSLIEMLSIK